MKKIVKIVFPFVFLFTMVGFEVARDLTIITNNKAALSTIITELIEEDNCTKDGKPGTASMFEFDANILNFRASSILRESIREIEIITSDINYKLLEQKVSVPPPKMFS